MTPSRKQTNLPMILCSCLFLTISTNVIATSNPPSTPSPSTLPQPHPLPKPTFLQSLRVELSAITSGSFEINPNIASSNCPSRSIKFNHFVPLGNGAYRISHSNIVMDDKRCGEISNSFPGNAAESDSYMDLFPIDFLMNESIALEKHANAALLRLQQSSTAFAFFNFARWEREKSPEEFNSWIGFEGYGRRNCGFGENQTGVEQNSIIFFGESGDMKIDISGLVGRKQGESRLYLEKNEIYQLMFHRNNPFGEEMVCAMMVRNEAGIAGIGLGNTGNTISASATASVSMSMTASVEASPSSLSIFGRRFEADDIKIGPFLLLDSRINSRNCVSRSAQYTKLIARGDGTYRVPHSGIYMDGKRCGSLAENATDDELWLDSHMELFPIDYLFNETIAVQKGANAALHNLLITRSARAFFNFSKTERLRIPEISQTWLGYERYGPRICGDEYSGQIQVDEGTYVFFGKNDEIRVDISALVGNITGDGIVYLDKIHPYQVMVQGNDQVGEFTCPLIFQDRTYREEAGEVRKCVTGDMRVEMADGSIKRMDELQVGDRVFDGKEESDVFMFSHRDEHSWSECIELHIGNHSICGSEGHLIETKDGGLVGFENVGKDDWVLLSNGEWKRVDGVGRSWRRGLYNAHTLSGRIVIEGVVISCYTRHLDARMAHAMLGVMRAVYGMVWIKLRFQFLRRMLQNCMRLGYFSSSPQIVSISTPFLGL